MTGVCDGGAACLFATDCKGSPPSVPWCTQVDAGILSSFSCINGACLWECTGGRVCSAAVDAGCVDCTIPVTQACAGSTCVNPTGTAVVESATCANPVVTPPVPFANTGLTFAPQGACLSRVGIEAGAPIGELTQLTTGDFLGDFPAMGGVCTGQMLPTNALRILVNCPGCQFVVRF
jgi:hypothetical protein